MYCAQSCQTLCNPMGCSLPGSSVPGVLQARILEWVAIPSPGDLTGPGIKPRSPALAGRFFTVGPQVCWGHTYFCSSHLPRREGLPPTLSRKEMKEEARLTSFHPPTHFREGVAWGGLSDCLWFGRRNLVGQAAGFPGQALLPERARSALFKGAIWLSHYPPGSPSGPSAPGDPGPMSDLDRSWASGHWKEHLGVIKGLFSLDGHQIELSLY